MGTRLMAQWQDADSTLLRDIQNMAGQLGERNITQTLGRLKNFTEVKNLHDRLVDRFNQANRRSAALELPYGAFPAPPLQGTDHIIPITNASALIDEGDKQSHCIASYRTRILDGRYYVYCILYPERATLGISMQGDSRPRIDQLKLKNNQTASQQTTNYVSNWMNNAAST